MDIIIINLYICNQGTSNCRHKISMCYQSTFWISSSSRSITDGIHSFWINLSKWLNLRSAIRYNILVFKYLISFSFQFLICTDSNTLSNSSVSESNRTKFYNLHFSLHFSNDLVASALKNIVSILVWFKMNGIESGPRN